jgi:perosamine synthetase
MKSIKMANADLNQDDIDAVVEVLKSGHLALGPKVVDFEKAMQDYCGVKHAIAVNSGTSGLHLIMLSLGIGPGDEVLVPSYTFVASVNAILYVGATPVFVDCDPEVFCFDVKNAQKQLTSKTKAMLVVDVFGHPAAWNEINVFAKAHNLKIIDDCCEALGSSYDGKKMGSFGDAGCFAFYPNKQMTTGEGGMIVTNDDEIAKMCKAYRNQGREEMSQWLEHKWVGYNFRLDEMSAALGVSQLRRIDTFVKLRAQVANWYNDLLSSSSYLSTPVVKEGIEMSWFVYVVKLNPGLNRDQVIQALAQRELPARAYFSGIHKQPYLKEFIKDKTLDLPVTLDIETRTLALPFHNHMTKEECEYVAKTLDLVLFELTQQKRVA